jgi:hypothetical protein
VRQRGESVSRFAAATFSRHDHSDAHWVRIARRLPGSEERNVAEWSSGRAGEANHSGFEWLAVIATLPT